MFADFFEKISFIVGVPVSTLLILPLVLALGIQVLRGNEYRSQVHVMARNNQERSYLNERNKFVAFLSLALFIVAGFVSFTVFQTRSLPRVNVEQLKLHQ